MLLLGVTTTGPIAFLWLMRDSWRLLVTIMTTQRGVLTGRFLYWIELELTRCESR